MNVGSLSFPRLQSVFRESGIAQAFFVWAFAMAYFGSKNKWLLLGLIFGLLLTFSTTGLTTALIVFPLVFFAKRGLSGTIRHKVITIIMYFTFH